MGEWWENIRDDLKTEPTHFIFQPSPTLPSHWIATEKTISIRRSHMLRDAAPALRCPTTSARLPFFTLVMKAPSLPASVIFPPTTCKETWKRPCWMGFLMYLKKMTHKISVTVYMSVYPQIFSRAVAEMYMYGMWDLINQWQTEWELIPAYF